MSYDTRLQRRVDWLVWAAALAFGVFAMRQLHAATPDAAAPTATVRAATVARPTTQTAEGTYRQECGDCHLAYAPRLLPAANWRLLMAGLDRHFGVDASLDPAAAAVIADWLSQRAGGGTSADGTSPRITTTPWFVREHREVPAWTWRRAAIGSAANCAACHTDAGRGRFSERALRIPNPDLSNPGRTSQEKRDAHDIDSRD
jgi:hypothetical protein